MQVVFKDEDEGSSGRRTDLMDLIICIRRIGRYLERKCVGRFGDRRSRIQVCRGIFGKNKEEVWRRR